MRVSVNGSVTKPQDLYVHDFKDFKDLYEAIAKAQGPGEKEDSDLIVPVAEWLTPYRAIKNIKTMSRIFVGDVDRKTLEECEELFEALQGTSAIIYTTHSHLSPKKDGLCCYRVILELDREYDPKDQDRLWSFLNSQLGEMFDTGARTAEQGYYLPAFPPERGHVSDIFRLEGDPLCVDDILAEAPACALPSEAQAGKPPPSKAVLKAQIDSWVRQADPEKKAVGKAARSLLEGKNEVPLHEGQRNQFLTSLAGYLAHVWPEAEGISAHFDTVGWALFNSDGKYPIETLEKIIQRMQAAERAKLIAEKKEAIAKATGGERDYEITAEEIAHIKTVFGPEWKKHLIACRKRDLYFLRPDGTYNPDPVMEGMLFVAARDRLGVFGDHVEYTYEDKDGNARRKTPKAFLEEYCKWIQGVVYDYTKPKGGYDPKTETIYLPAATPLVEPEGFEDIQDWLESMDDHLIDMLARMPHLDQMLPALVLTGPKSCGKTLLATGLGQIYGRAPADGDEALGNFNANILTKQPIVFMDEKTTDGYQKEGTTLIRKFVTQGSRHLDEKYQSRVELIGYPRIVVAANNVNVLATKQDMSREDREAFAERLVHIDMAPGAEILEKLGKPYIQKEWLDNRRLAKHILFLSLEWEIRHPGQRFAVAANHTNMHDGLASKAGAGADVSCWLLSFLESPTQAKHLPIEAKKGYLRVSPKALIAGWGVYLHNHRSPSPSEISQALKSLSQKGLQKIIYVSGGTTKRVDAYEIDLNLLREANKMHRIVQDFDELFLTDCAK